MFATAPTRRQRYKAAKLAGAQTFEATVGAIPRHAPRPLPAARLCRNQAAPDEARQRPE